MDYFSLINATKETEMAYARWYSELPTERKTQMIADVFQFGIDTVRYNTKKENPFLSDSEVMLRYIELNLKKEFSEEIFSFIRQKMLERGEEEWKARFRKMKKELGWSYEEMASYMGAGSAESVRASVSRGLPAFARLAVCVFEEMKAREKDTKG